ncbi:ABC transporter permease subunit [Sanguibacter suaedae]|uniref:ABC transporter permease subunit n=1 Tax=Sanguibacter suaedae TaxID=2795737 RepID=A0A934I8X2_9MICO|nr:ABC transporter permease subunit [Sanguibacter suaedae]MBI9113513.1 ABC transporter permease subunit [Sanguibacter suaedae]
MMRLLLVELDRFRSRRLPWLAVLGLLAVVALAVFSAWQTGRPATGSELAMMEESHQSALAEWEETSEAQIADCLDLDWADTEAECEEMLEPSWENYSWEAPTFAAKGVAPAADLAYPVLFVALLVGASLVAAEFSTRSIGGWLTFEPRRGRVYATKVLAPALGVLLPMAVVVTLAVLGTWAAYTVNDHVGPMTSELWGDLAGAARRTVLLSAAFAAIGAALAAVLRSTVAVVGIVVAYVVVVEGMLAGYFLELRPRLLMLNLEAVVQGGTTYGVETCTAGANGVVCEYVDTTLSLTHGVVTYAVVLAVLVAVGALVFRRRDVG